jgi:hypothetical protein
MKYNIIFTGWKENLKKVSFVSLLRDRGGLSFLSAKRTLEALLLGEETIIEMPLETAKEIKKEATKLGAKCKIVEVNRGEKKIMPIRRRIPSTMNG